MTTAPVFDGMSLRGEEPRRQSDCSNLQELPKISRRASLFLCPASILMKCQQPEDRSQRIGDGEIWPEVHTNQNRIGRGVLGHFFAK